MTTRDPGARDVFTQGLDRRPRATAFWASSPAASMTWGFEVLVQLVMAAMTTWPSADLDRRRRRRAWPWPSAQRRRRVARRRARPMPSASTKPAFVADSDDPVLGPRRAGQARLDGGQVELDTLGEHRLGVLGPVEQALFLGVGLDQRHVVLVAAGEAQVVEGDVVDGEDHAGGPVLGRHVADGGPALEGELGQARAVDLDELPHHAVVAQQLGDGEDEVGGGRPLGQLAGEPQPDDGRDEHGEGLAEHGRLGLDAAHAPAEDAEAVHHGGVGVGPHQGVGEGRAVGGGEDHPGQVLEVHLVADARPRRDHPEAVEGLLGPAQELVALDVALVLDVDVGGERRRPGPRTRR